MSCWLLLLRKSAVVLSDLWVLISYSYCAVLVVFIGNAGQSSGDAKS